MTLCSSKTISTVNHWQLQPPLNLPSAVSYAARNSFGVTSLIFLFLFGQPLYLHVEGSQTSFEKLEGHENGRYMRRVRVSYLICDCECAHRTCTILSHSAIPTKFKAFSRIFSHNFSTVSIAISLWAWCVSVCKGGDLRFLSQLCPRTHPTQTVHNFFCMKTPLELTLRRAD